MAVTIDASPLRDFVRGFAGEATAVEWLWQAGVAAAALVLGWYAARAICAQVRPSPRWMFGEGDLRSDIFKALLRSFRAQGVEIPYPRHDVRLLATPETGEIPSVSNT